jgi:hypothetical protein
MSQNLYVSLTVAPINDSPKPLQGGLYPIEKDYSGWYAVIYEEWPAFMIYQDLCRRAKQLYREYDDALYDEEYDLEEELETTLSVLYKEYTQIEHALSNEQVSHIDILLDETVSAKVTFQISKAIGQK